MLIQSFRSLWNDFSITGKLSLCLIGLNLFLCPWLHLKRLIVKLGRKFIEKSLKAGPIVCFLFTKNELIIQSDLKASNVGEKHVFFG
jgi:hypothetical protein